MVLAASWKQVLRARGLLHLGLCLTWLVVGATGQVGTLAVEDGGDLGAGFGMQDVTVRSYLLTQPEVLLHYLRLSFWPDPLVLDYRWPLVDSVTEALVPGLVIVVLLGAALVAATRGSALGFLGLWFFVILAPTSSFVPVHDAAFEHRMYLPLAPLAIGAVLLADALLRKLDPSRSSAMLRSLATLAFLGAVLALGARTWTRNRDYRDDVRLWHVTARDVPGNDRAHNLLALALARKGRHDEAFEALRIGLAYLDAGADSREARRRRASLHGNWGNLLLERGANEEAVEHYRQSLELDPSFAGTHSNWGVALRRIGRYEEARDHLRAALALAPESAEIQNNLAWLLATCPVAALRDGHEAILLAERAALAKHYRDPATLDTLAAAHAEAGDFPSAVRCQELALELAPEPERPRYRPNLELYLRHEPFRESNPARIGPP
jgi:Flp pilus assembly protein TadD